MSSVQFTGKERDAETGLDYFGARYFSSAQGRFTSSDWSAIPEPVPYADLTDPQTLNLYAYVRNNPLRSVDLDGHAHFDECEQGEAMCQPNQAMQLVQSQPAKQHKRARTHKSPYQAGNKAANVLYHETSSLRPKSGETDAGDLHAMRLDAAHVYQNVHHKSAFQDSNTLSADAQAALRHQVPDALAAYKDSLAAVAEAAADRSDPTGGANHFFIRDITLGDKQGVPSWANGNEISFGPFITSSRGDGGIRAGDTVYVWITKE